MNQLLKNSNDNIKLSSDEKLKRLHNAEIAYGQFLTELGYDWENDPNMNKTPYRVAKMWLNEIANGCFDECPEIAVFKNVNKYDGLVFEGNIDVKSLCSHHNYPFFGKAFVSYIAHPDGNIIGLSKFNRVVDWFSRRPQVQENLVMQIHDYLDKILGKHQGIAIKIQAVHTCVKLRGANQDSDMQTTKLSGAFIDPTGNAQKEFFENIRHSLNY